MITEWFKGNDSARLQHYIFIPGLNYLWFSLGGI